MDAVISKIGSGEKGEQESDSVLDHDDFMQNAIVEKMPESSVGGDAHLEVTRSTTF